MKLQDIQSRLVVVEETALEKELLFQQVDRLCQKQEKAAEAGKMPALELSRQINAAQVLLSLQVIMIIFYWMIQLSNKCLIDY